MDWEKLLGALIPTGVALARPGQSGAAFVQGYQGADYRLHQQRLQDEEAQRRQQALEAEQRNREADNQRQDQHARLQRLAMALQQMNPAIEQQAETATDPMAAQQTLGNQSRQLEQSFELPQGAMRPFVPTAQTMAPMISQAKIRRAKAKYAEFLKLYGDRANEAESSMTFEAGEFAGMTPAAVRQMAEMTQPPPAKPKEPTPRQAPAPGSQEEFSDPNTTPERKAQILADRKAYMQVDDRPSAQGRTRYVIQSVTNPDGTTGLVRVDLDTNQAEPINLGQAGAGRPTDTQRLSKAYFDRTEASDKLAQSFEQQLTTLGRQLGPRLPTLLASSEGQRYKQAKDEFINAALRRESGAAIQPSEYTRFDQIYFVVPGDTPETIRQKQAARKRVIDGFRVTAGNITTTPGASDDGDWIDMGNGVRVREKKR